MKSKYIKFKSQSGGSMYTQDFATKILNIYTTDPQFVWSVHNRWSLYSGERKENAYLTPTNVKLDKDININTFDFDTLNIENDINRIESIYKEIKVIELRPYRGETTLIIGCGNYRLDDGNLGKTSDDNRPKYNMFHAHRNCYTIDAVLPANPSTVALFDNNKIFKNLPDNAFNLIIFEGGGDPHVNPREIERLLNKNSLSLCIGMNDSKYYVFSQSDKNGYKIIN